MVGIAPHEVTMRTMIKAAVLSLLAETLQLPRGSVTLVSGHGHRDKVVELAGVEPDRVAERLAFSAGKDTNR